MSRLSEPVYKLGPSITVTSEMLHDAGYRLWELPNRNPMPRLTPFPRVARLQRQVRFARERVEEAWHVLRHGLPEIEDW